MTPVNKCYRHATESSFCCQQRLDESRKKI
uniref:Uncharacterized protein n=1 Tax=Podoviridae sp. ctiwu7 TaxID=2825269 RepID=A0A8S5QDG9_9CAUD|nr:MAG TPA: hypothetical protein [Podoviridae sp. ctiwu7]